MPLPLSMATQDRIYELFNITFVIFEESTGEGALMTVCFHFVLQPSFFTPG
jgi:hypothetical protein